MYENLNKKSKCISELFYRTKILRQNNVRKAQRRFSELKSVYILKNTCLRYCCAAEIHARIHTHTHASLEHTFTEIVKIVLSFTYRIRVYRDPYT